jgi:hypothetical protein
VWKAPPTSESTRMVFLGELSDGMGSSLHFVDSPMLQMSLIGDGIGSQAHSLKALQLGECSVELTTEIRFVTR